MAVQMRWVMNFSKLDGSRNSLGIARHEMSMYTSTSYTHITIDIIQSCNFSSQTTEEQCSVHELGFWVFWLLHIGSSFGDTPGIPENVISSIPKQAPHRCDGFVRVFLIRLVIIIIIVGISTTGTSALPYQTSSRTCPFERTGVFVRPHPKLHKLFLRRARWRERGRRHVVPWRFGRIRTL